MSEVIFENKEYIRGKDINLEPVDIDKIKFDIFINCKRCGQNMVGLGKSISWDWKDHPVHHKLEDCNDKNKLS